VSDQPLGPGWWKASDGKWYPPQGMQQPAVYKRDTNQTMAYGAVGGCLLGVLILLGVLAALMLLGLAVGPK
jgi:hypothetical protein